MLKMSSRCVGAAFFGIVSALVSGLCFGIRAWWPAGICLAAAFACLCWCSRGALLIDEVLTRFGVPLEGIYNTESILEKVKEMSRTGPPQPRPEPKPRPRWRGGKDQVN